MAQKNHARGAQKGVVMKPDEEKCGATPIEDPDDEIWQPSCSLPRGHPPPVHAAVTHEGVLLATWTSEHDFEQSSTSALLFRSIAAVRSLGDYAARELKELEGRMQDLAAQSEGGIRRRREKEELREIATEEMSERLFAYERLLLAGSLSNHERASLSLILSRVRRALAIVGGWTD